ncbi:hypothetical protein Spa11_31190 [Botrimarina mediterranea]|uniref:Uncharacterized protein n=1 Tax=Botrimarina mediterranea TaxID=2528022 RepID=A0A518KAU4_9BACT|nr:hypothetical protein Spa11_31190 [Botrimarina mediterranea]
MRSSLRKSLAASLLAVVAASSGYFVGYQHAGGLLGKDTSVTSVTYPVRDLVVSWDPKDTEPDYDGLTNAVQTYVLPDSWNATHSIKTDRKLMALVVSHTKKGHEEVATLLSQLRSLHNVYTSRTKAGVCGHCGNGSLPNIGERCRRCEIPRHDPPAA